MQIVIDIDEDTYKEIKRGKIYTSVRDVPQESVVAIANGTPLPEHHGRLGDLDKLYTEMNNGIKAGLHEDGYENYGHINDMDDCLECVKYADVSIETDKAESEEQA